MMLQLCWSLADKLFCCLNKTKVFNTRLGVKSINASLKIERINERERMVLPAEELLLGFDFLQDRYTLFGVKIKDSPHYQLMKDIQGKANICNSEYIARLKSGTLDARRPIFVSHKRLESFYRTFQGRTQEIIADSYEPVIIYELNSEYYIYDGKHRAALCQLLNKGVKCVIIDASFLYEPTYLKYFSIMKSYVNSYLKQSLILTDVIKCFELIH